MKAVRWLNRAWRLALTVGLTGALTLVVSGLLGLSTTGPAYAGLNQWTTNGPEGGDIRALAVDPLAPTTVYAGTGGGGVFKSTNGGASWTAMNSGLTNPFVSALAIDPITGLTLYAGTRGGGVFDFQIAKAQPTGIVPCLEARRKGWFWRRRHPGQIGPMCRPPSRNTPNAPKSE